MARSRNSSKSKDAAAATQEKLPQGGVRSGRPRLVVSRRTAGPGRRAPGAARSAGPIGLASGSAEIDDDEESPYERPLVPSVREVKAPRRSGRD